MEKRDTKKILSIIFNIIIVVLELYAFVECLKISGIECFEYYTQDSNLLLMISSILYLFYILRGKRLPHSVTILKYSATTAVMVTFIVVLTILAPTMGGYKVMMLDGTMKFHHLICPILAIITFLFFEPHQLDGITDALKAMIFTFIYSVIVIFLNVIGVMYGPYPFLKVYEQSVLESVMWVCLMIGSNYMINSLIGYINNKLND